MKDVIITISFIVTLSIISISNVIYSRIQYDKFINKIEGGEIESIQRTHK